MQNSSTGSGKAVTTGSIAVQRFSKGMYNLPVSQVLELSPQERNYQLNSEEYLAARTRLDSYPYHIQIGADNRCNLKCEFCIAAALREQGLPNFQDAKPTLNAFEIFRRLQPWMKFWKYLSVTGPGESLINPKLDDILHLVRAESDCIIVITTNGVLINERLARLFIDDRVDEISISIDSLQKEVYEALRVNARLETVLRAIDLVNEEKQKRNSPLPRLNLTPNFSRRNIGELPSFIRFAKEKGVNVVQATPTQVYRASWVKDSLLNFPRLTRRVARKAERLASKLEVQFVNELRMVYAKQGRGIWGLFGRSVPQDLPTDPSLCQKPWSGLYVEQDGEVRPCCYLSPNYGNVFETNFEEIWNGPEARALRKAMIEKKPPPACRACNEFNRHDPSIMIQLDLAPKME